MYKTYTWEEVAKYLLKDGHEIRFLVQNQIFKPKKFKSTFIPYPKKSNLKKSNKNFEKITKSDRNINYFGGNNKHYDYYYQEIEKYIKKYKPNVVFGESTLFHELMAIEICKRNKILFLHPSEIGYPKERIAFYKYDTKEPYDCNKNKKKYDKDARNFITDINNRSLKPRYMKIKKSTFLANLNDKILRIAGRLGGEVYNTPSIIKKIELDKILKKLIISWNKKSIKISEIISIKEKVILFPMHMQPEANIDLWGQEYRDQTKLIQKIAEYLPSGWKLVVKLNPKTKYELTPGLLKICFENKNIIPIKSNQRMVDIFEKSDVIITITGTVLIECIYLNKPILSLIKSEFLSTSGNQYLDNVKDIKCHLDNYKNISISSYDEKINFYNKMINYTFDGKIISGPFDQIDKKNTLRLYKAFNEVLQSI